MGGEQPAGSDIAEPAAGEPDFAEEWAQLALARELAAELIRYRAQHTISQRRLAALLDVTQAELVELESGEQCPTAEMVAHVSTRLRLPQGTFGA